MPLRIFTVNSETQWSDDKEWTKEDPLSVAADDAEAAIGKAKKHLLATKPVALEDGAKTKIIAVRILGVGLEAEADL
jgi:hypothetical protein